MSASAEAIEAAARKAAARALADLPYDAQGIDADIEWRMQPEAYREQWRAEARWWAEALGL